LHALRDISAGTEMTIDYNAHEDELLHPFECSCGAAKCVETVRGGRFPDRF
jgi:SET domain-containing protein